MAEAGAAQRMVDTKTELTTRRVLTRRTLAILASDGPPCRRSGAGAALSAASAEDTRLQRVTAQIFSDGEQAELLGSTFRCEAPQAIAQLQPRSALQSTRVILDLGRIQRPRCGAVGPGLESTEAELRDGFRAVRLWAPQRVLSQFVLDTCRASLQPEPEPEPEPRAKRQRAQRGTGDPRPEIGLAPASSVLELNAGTGVCGVFAAHGIAALGGAGRVFLADRCAAALQLLQLNTGLSVFRERTVVCEQCGDELWAVTAGSAPPAGPGSVSRGR
jgi:hypothetical protein